MLISDILAGIITGAAVGLGIGGGGLLVIYLTMIRGVNQIEAQGINLLFFLFASVSSLLIHQTRRPVRGSIVLILACTGIIGAAAGEAILTLITSAGGEGLVRDIFGVMLIASGIFSLVRK